jgi:hypothetical protein
MNHSSRAPWPTSNIENDQIRLQNVFRVLCKPEHALWEEALELRLEISARWSSYAAQNQWFPWPTTSAPPSARKLKGIEWRPYGMLSFLGYHVGETEPTPLKMRWGILEYAFECHLPPLISPAYYLEWGGRLIAQRLRKTANTLAGSHATLNAEISYRIRGRLTTGRATCFFCTRNTTLIFSISDGPQLIG